MPTPSTPKYELRGRDVFRNGKKAVTINEDNSLEFVSKSYQKYDEEIQKFLVSESEKKTATKKAATKKAKPKDKPLMDSLFESFAQSFREAQPIARLILVKKHRSFFDEFADVFSEVLEVLEERETTAPNKPTGYTPPPPHPDEPPQDPRYGDTTPAVFDWRRDNWKDEDFKKVYLNRMKGIERLRLEIDGLAAAKVIEHAFETDSLNTPEVKKARDTANKSFEVINLERKVPGLSQKLDILDQVFVASTVS
jgi:hypothetical protein